MPLAIPPELQKISPFVRRAEELDRDKSSPESRLVAYYCRQYAVHTGIPLASSSPAAKTCLGHLLEQLEKEKPAMDNFTRDEAAFLCRKFATNIFNKADQEDRSGVAGKNTAKAFYAAASFLQILEQFEQEGGSAEGSEDRKQILYAKWKATDILKVLKEGRTPTPGGYGQVDEEGGDDGNGADGGGVGHVVQQGPTDDDSDTGGQKRDDDVFHPPPVPRPMPPPQPVTPPPPMDEPDDEEEEESEAGTEVELGPPPPAYPGEDTINNGSPASNLPKLSFNLPPVDATPVFAPPPAKKTGGGLFGMGKKKKAAGATVSKEQIADATELTRFALAALDERDTELAVERLQQALEALGR